MKKPLQGTVNLPGSKSESNRALMIAAYAGFPLEVEGLSEAHDTVLLKELLDRSSLRASNDVADDVVIVDCEDAGTVARFLLTYLSNKPGTWLLTGTERLCQRPMAPLIDALRQLGADIDGDSLPLLIKGKPLKGGHVILNVSQSSQFASSLLMAAPTFECGLQLTLTGTPVSMPYLEMTVKMMEYFGVKNTRDGHQITVDPQPYHQRYFKVSPDWSAASYWYEMMALGDGGELLLKGLRADSLQGDAVVATWFKQLGVATVFNEQGAWLTKVAFQPQKLVFDFTDTPDLFPAVYVTSAMLGLDAVFEGTATLSDKESDRFNALKTELSKISRDARTASLPVFCAHNDHRIAMSLAAIWPLYGPVSVDNPSVVNKSYPHFWEDLNAVF